MNYKIVLALIGSIVTMNRAMEPATKKLRVAPSMMLSTLEQIKQVVQQGDSIDGMQIEEDLRLQAMWWVLQEGEADALESLLASGCDANMALEGIPYGPQARPLHIAIQHNHISKILLTYGAAIDLCNAELKGPVTIALESNASEELCQLLIDSGACIEGKTRRRWLSWGPWSFIFRTIISNDRYDLGKLFLDRGGDLRDQGPGIERPLILAARQPVNSKVIKSLIGNACYVPIIRNNADQVRSVRTFLCCMKRMGYGKDLGYQVLTALPELREQVAIILIPLLLNGLGHRITDIRLQEVVVEKLVDTTCRTLVPLMQEAREKAHETDKHQFDVALLSGEYGQLILKNVVSRFLANTLLSGRVPEV